MPTTAETVTNQLLIDSLLSRVGGLNTARQNLVNTIAQGQTPDITKDLLKQSSDPEIDQGSRFATALLGSLGASSQNQQRNQLVQALAGQNPTAAAALGSNDPALQSIGASLLKPEDKTEIEKKLDAAGISDPAERQKLIVDSITRPQNSVTINEAKVETAGAIERAKKEEERRGGLIEGIYTSADGARDVLANLTPLKANLKELVAGGSSTGPAASGVAFLKSLASQAGIEVDITDASNIEQIKAASNRIAIPLAKKLGVNPTDRDFARTIEAIPNILSNPRTGFAVIDTLEQLSNKALALEQKLIDLQASGASEVEIRKARAESGTQPIIPALELPKDRKPKQGSRYLMNDGIYVWDGTKFVGVD